MRCLAQPRTVNGRFLYLSLIFYLSSAISLFAAPSQSKPSTAVARTLQTRNFSADMKTALKESINALQDLDYTIDVLNSDVGLITASRTTEEKKAAVSKDGVESGPSPKIDEAEAEAKAETKAASRSNSKSKSRKKWGSLTYRTELLYLYSNSYTMSL